MELTWEEFQQVIARAQKALDDRVVRRELYESTTFQGQKSRELLFTWVRRFDLLPTVILEVAGLPKSKRKDELSEILTMLAYIEANARKNEGYRRLAFLYLSQEPRYQKFRDWLERRRIQMDALYGQELAERVEECWLEFCTPSQYPQAS